MPPSTDDWVNHLPAAVSAFTTAGLRLTDELMHLGNVRRVAAHEASIFHCARILEAISAEAVRLARLPVVANLHANLETLREVGLTPTPTACWAHALRRAGNEVRHLHRRVTLADAELAALFAERCLEWYFREFAFGSRLPTLTGLHEALHLGEDAELRRLLTLVESAGQGSAALADAVTLSEALSAPAVVLAALAEFLLDRGCEADAETVLTSGLARFAEDVRLRQLRGVWLSRTGRRDEAIEEMTALSEQRPGDPETEGILGGALKRRWQATRERADLERAYRVYRDSWRETRRSNVYLGINTATTALWSGRTDEARQAAETVRQRVAERQAIVEGCAGVCASAWYWNLATWTEAELILKDWSAARRVWHRALAAGAGLDGCVDVSLRQFDRIVEHHVGRPLKAREMLG